MTDAAELERTLAELAAAGGFQVYEDGRLVPEPGTLQFEVRRQAGRTRLHLWSESRTLVRTVAGVVNRADDRLVLAVERFGKAKPGRLEFVAATRPAGRGRTSRGAFLDDFRRLLIAQFPDERIESLSIAPDLEHSFSRCYARGVLARGQQAWAVMGAGPDEDQATVDAMLAFGLIWLDWTRSRARRAAVRGLRLFVPEERAGTLAHRIGGLAPGLRTREIELYELPTERGMWRARRLDPADMGNLATQLTPRRDIEATFAAAAEFAESVRRLSPEAIDAVVAPGAREVSVRFRGLEFARWRSGRVEFGLAPRRQVLTAKNGKALERLVRQLERHRRADAASRAHPLYRAQPERWLEAMLWSNPTRVDPLLLPDHVCAQVAISAAGDRGVIDLLGARRDGRLAVIELKADEDLQLPIQALDYWLRVRRHLEAGDFPRHGYFDGVELTRHPPVLYLVAPGLRWHPTTETLLRCFSPEVEVHRIGINEDWRRGVRVVERL
jgi:hypothetical protein